MGIFSRILKKKVLFVDDEPAMITIMKTRIQTRNYEVLTASDSMTAIQLAQRHVPDLIILDVNMPPPDGIEVCRRLKADEKTSRIPVVMFTCVVSNTLEADCIHAGALGVVYKPQVRDLFELMSKIIAGKKIDWAEYKNES